MRLLAGILWVSTALEVCVSAQAILHTPDSVPRTSNKQPLSISPNTARLLLAQRLGLSQYHSLGQANEDDLGILNTYGGIQQQLFGNDDLLRSANKLIIIVEGLSNPEDIITSSMRAALSIDPQPSSSHNLDLAQDLLDQDSHSRGTEGQHGLGKFKSSSSIRGGFSASGLNPNDFQGRDQIFQAKEPKLSEYLDFYKSIGSRIHGSTTILHVSTLQGLTPKDGPHYTAAISDLNDFLSYMLDPESHITSTIIFMPATSAPNKRSTASPYGSYTKPLSARQAQQAEEPLSSPSSPSSPSTKSKPSAPSTLQATNNTLPRGIIPTCHSTLSAAIAATHNCSGHGTPYLKSSGETDCYACRCSKTVLTDDEGRVKTVYWGGPACQKKDISVPFFLLAGLSIGLVAAITWGIGLMASIGQEELPSVIGAGVTGPRAQK